MALPCDAMIAIRSAVCLIFSRRDFGVCCSPPAFEFTSSCVAVRNTARTTMPITSLLSHRSPPPGKRASAVPHIRGTSALAASGIA
jgi:hypothetical protein